MARTSIYVDGGPFLHGIRYQGLSMDVDIMALARGIAAQDHLHEVHFIVAEYPAFPYPTKHRNEKARLQAFREQGVQVHLCRTQIIGSIFVERGVEATFAARMISDAYMDRFDRAILISRRPEFATVIQAVLAAGKAVDVAFLQFESAPVNPLEQDCTAATTISVEQVLKYALTRKTAAGAEPAADV